MFCDHLDLKKLYIYILLKNILFTKLTYFDYHNKNVETFTWKSWEFEFNKYKSNATSTTFSQ